MRQSFKVEMNRAFRNRQFVYAAIVGCVISIWYFYKFSWPLIEHVLAVYHGTVSDSFFEKVNYATPVTEGWMGTHVADGYFLILPILCMIPYGISYVMDSRSGYIGQLTTRVGKKNYYRAKLLAVFISGGAIAVIPLLLNLILCMCFLPIMFPVASTQLFPVSGSSVLCELFYSKSWSFLYIILYIMFDFLFYGLLNCVSLLMSFFEENRFAIALSPFIIVFAFHVLCGWGIGKAGYSPLHFTYLPHMYKSDVGVIMTEFLVLAVCAFLFLKGSRQDIL